MRAKFTIHVHCTFPHPKHHAANCPNPKAPCFASPEREPHADRFAFHHTTKPSCYAPPKSHDASVPSSGAPFPASCWQHMKTRPPRVTRDMFTLTGVNRKVHFQMHVITYRHSTLLNNFNPMVVHWCQSLEKQTRNELNVHAWFPTRRTKPGT